MSEKDTSAKVRFIGWMDTRQSKWEGVTEHHVKEAIDDMSEEELRQWLKMSFKSVESYH